jgi:hypothetical protein
MCVLMYCVIVPVLGIGPLTSYNTSPNPGLGLGFPLLSDNISESPIEKSILDVQLMN